MSDASVSLAADFVAAVPVDFGKVKFLYEMQISSSEHSHKHDRGRKVFIKVGTDSWEFTRTTHFSWNKKVFLSVMFYRLCLAAILNR